jgi:hypothetical protein
MQDFWPNGYTTTLVYWIHKHQHTIGTFNTCSWVPTPRSLPNVDGGYNLRDADLHIPLSDLPQSTVSTLHLQAPPSLHFYPTLISNSECVRPIADTWYFDHLTSTDTYVYA